MPGVCGSPEYFESIWDGSKTFECRLNDRDFHTGDYLLLQEWDPKVPRKLFLKSKGGPGNSPTTLDPPGKAGAML